MQDHRASRIARSLSQDIHADRQYLRGERGPRGTLETRDRAPTEV